MSWYEKFGDLANGVVLTILAAIMAVGGWIVRTILTNQKLVQKLETEIKIRQEQREMELQMMVDLKRDIRELRADVKMLFSNHGGSRGGSA